MTVRIAIPDVVSPSYFPAIAAVELGYFEQRGVQAQIESVYPVSTAFELLRAGDVDFVGGSAHAALYVFEQWVGCKLLCALSQHMYWFLVVHSSLDIKRGDLLGLRGLRIGAAPGPVDGLYGMLEAVGMDPHRDLTIGPIQGATGASVSFGVTAARALEEGEIDGFWANGMGKEVAVRGGYGKIVVDARRSDGPRGARDYTFAALVTTADKVTQQPKLVSAAITAVADAQAVLVGEPELARIAAYRHFPDYERDLIADLVKADSPYYDPSLSRDRIAAVNRFAFARGLLSKPELPYDEVVASIPRTGKLKDAEADIQ